MNTAFAMLTTVRMSFQDSVLYCIAASCSTSTGVPGTVLILKDARVQYSNKSGGQYSTSSSEGCTCAIQ
jgi:hypothetical protein